MEEEGLVVVMVDDGVFLANAVKEPPAEEAGAPPSEERRRGAWGMRAVAAAICLLDPISEASPQGDVDLRSQASLRAGELASWLASYDEDRCAYKTIRKKGVQCVFVTTTLSRRCSLVL